jgi:hypothetical protein
MSLGRAEVYGHPVGDHVFKAVQARQVWQLSPVEQKVAIVVYHHLARIMPRGQRRQRRLTV